jgi:hypothetical protein
MKAIEGVSELKTPPCNGYTFCLQNELLEATSPFWVQNGRTKCKASSLFIKSEKRALQERQIA